MSTGAVGAEGPGLEWLGGGAGGRSPGISSIRYTRRVPLLYYWQPDNFRRDLDMGAGYHLSQGNPLLHSIDIGDSLWAFTRMKDGRYAIAAQLVVRAKTINPPGFRYGKYRVWGDLTQSRYFQVAGQSNAEDLLRRISGRRDAKILARAFQGYRAVRPLDAAGDRLLRAWVKSFPPEPRAKVWSEEQLEAEIVLGDAEGVRRLLEEERAGIAKERRAYLLQRASRPRNDSLIRELQDLYSGRCQLCEWNPHAHYGAPLCEGHHIVWMSRGGEDKLDNMVLLCPNHHRAVHGCDAPLDWRDLSFDFGDGRREQVRVNEHLAA
jgi:5-methylcytosine-specific restriction protein A